MELKESKGRLLPLEGIGPQSSLLFSADGSRLAAGSKVRLVNLKIYRYDLLFMVQDFISTAYSFHRMDIYESLNGQL